MASRSVLIRILARDEFTKKFRKIRGKVLALTAAFAGVGVAARKAQLAAEKQQDAEQRLAAAYRKTGIAVKEALERDKEFAASLQRVTTAADETILSQRALLVSLGRLSGETLDRATRAALDYAAATGKDLRDAFVALSKAAVGNFDSLRENGIIIDESVPKAERFETALRLLENAFGGTSEELAKTASGIRQQLGNAIGDLFEQLGAPFLNTEFVDFLRQTTEDVAGLTGQLAEFISGLQKLRRESGKADLAAAFARGIVPVPSREPSFAEQLGFGPRAPGGFGDAVRDDFAKIRNEIETAARSVIERADELGIRQGRALDAFREALGEGIPTIERINRALVELNDTIFAEARARAEIADSLQREREIRRNIAQAELELRRLGTQRRPEVPIPASLAFEFNAPAPRVDMGDVKAQAVDAGEAADIFEEIRSDAIAAGEAAGVAFDEMSFSAQAAAVAIEDSIVGIFDALLFGTQSWSDAVMSALRGFLNAIVSELAQRAAVSFISGFLTQGGVVHAAGGLVVPGSGTVDRVPALLTPGEVVLSRPEAQRYFERSGDAGRGDVNLTIAGRADPEHLLREFERFAALRFGRRPRGDA